MYNTQTQRCTTTYYTYRIHRPGDVPHYNYTTQTQKHTITYYNYTIHRPRHTTGLHTVLTETQDSEAQKEVRTKAHLFITEGYVVAVGRVPGQGSNRQTLLMSMPAVCKNPLSSLLRRRFNFMVSHLIQKHSSAKTTGDLQLHGTRDLRQIFLSNSSFSEFCFPLTLN